MCVGVERHPDGAIADGMRHHLPAARIGEADTAVEIVGRDVGNTGVGSVRVGREHRGRMRFDDAVEADLQRAGLEQRAVRVLHPDRLDLVEKGLVRCAGRRERSVQADPKLAGASGFVVELEILDRPARHLHARDAVALRLGDRGAQRPRPILACRRRHEPVDE